MLERIETPTYPSNGNLRMYNMFPYRRYADNVLGIEDMTSYIPEIAAMGFNAVWINPLQLPGTMKQVHADGIREVSGSLYAMADDQALNPLIFPQLEKDDAATQQHNKLKIWATEVRKHGMFPLFDLVLNHIGMNEGGLTKLQQDLIEAEKQKPLNLLLRQKNERWVDIQQLDYYKDGSLKRGINTEPKDLDFDKIEAIFKVLWEPLLTRYIKEYGFMGVRVDALTHIPVPVQQRAYQLIQKLVRDTYGTDALIVGELMVGSADIYLSALSACGLTHCMNPYSFFWGSEIEGGYGNTKDSAFYKQNTQISEAILSSPKAIKDFKKLQILHDELDTSKKMHPDTVYLFIKEGRYLFALNRAETDICFNKASLIPIDKLNEPSLENLLVEHKALIWEQKSGGVAFNQHEAALRETLKQDPQKLKVSLQEAKTYFLNQQKELKAKQELKSNLIAGILRNSILNQHPAATIQAGGTVAVLGNHDVGTLRAKVMLDLAYTKALNKAENNTLQRKQELLVIYKEFKQSIIKGVSSSVELDALLRQRFTLSELDMLETEHELATRMREKIFIQSMMSSGGWYILAGDEVGLCHKPEVFAEFATGNNVGMSLSEHKKIQDNPYQLTGFISGINKVLKSLPSPSPKDVKTMHCLQLDTGINTAMLFMVLHHDVLNNQYHLIAHCAEGLSCERLYQEVNKFFGKKLECTVHFITNDGLVNSYNHVAESNYQSSSRDNASLQYLSKLGFYNQCSTANQENSISEQRPSLNWEIF